ncbi:MAG: SGNH/GDSL hydrolase family protein [Nostocoides sp.]
MLRARRARKIAATAAYGGGGLAAAATAATALGYGIVKAEAALARRIVGEPFDSAPDDDGSYGSGHGEVLELVVLGDSSAAGMGCDRPEQTIGAIVATGLAALTGRQVRLTNVAVVGAESQDLPSQLGNTLESVPRPEAALILIGANDVTHRADRATAVHHLTEAVGQLRSLGAAVVVGTCPDLGTIRPVRPPLRQLMRRWSRDLAAAQTVAVVQAGGRTVSLGDLLGPEFEAHPEAMFSQDQFHPSPAGYARAAASLLPTLCAALGVWGVDTADRAPERQRGEAVEPVAVAAGQAVRDPGTEVSPTAVAGQSRGPRGPWAVLLRRRHTPQGTSADELVAEHEAIETQP